jgi:hypothetical protein
MIRLKAAFAKPSIKLKTHPLVGWHPLPASLYTPGWRFRPNRLATSPAHPQLIKAIASFQAGDARDVP